MKLAAVTALGIGLMACSSSSGSPDTVQTHHDGGSVGDDGGAPGTDGGGTTDPTTIAGFCNGLLTTIATIESKCEGGSVADWEAELGGSNSDTCAALASAEAAGRVKFDGSQASTCLAAYSAITCDDLTLSTGTEPASCAATLSGRWPRGAPATATTTAPGPRATARSIRRV